MSSAMIARGIAILQRGRAEFRRMQDSATPCFDFAPTLPASGATPTEKFADYHAKNPHIFRNIQMLARARVRQGKRLSMKGIFEDMREEWQRGNAGLYALDNNFTAYYARLLIQECPELAGRIETRRMRVS